MRMLRIDRILSNLGLTVSRRDIPTFLRRNVVRLCWKRDANAIVADQPLSFNKQTADSFLSEPVKHAKQRIVPEQLSGLIVNEDQYIPMAGHWNEVTLLVYKPAGVVCSHVRESPDVPTVFDLLPVELRRLRPPLAIAGRLDKFASGLVVLSQDGQLVQRISQPGSTSKVYEVETVRPIEAHLLQQLPAMFAAGGIRLRGEDEPCKAATLRVNTPSSFTLALRQGQYHQVRRMFAAAANARVNSLFRSTVGPWSLPYLGDLCHAESNDTSQPRDFWSGLLPVLRPGEWTRVNDSEEMLHLR
eukprot:TRINITY_DN6188_c0_g1_i1.p1 TRINITY_DN6188_c0_g1~~TRINITY_DN6188_c0_g1_i1.p1  ORF type:complete len:301 (+),score=25.53 TRINITY_DN6188_c0_g1_i1:189-1091(+)